VVLAAAYETLGSKGDSEAQIVLAWVSQTLTTGDEAYLLKNYAALLRPYHTARLDMLLWQGKTRAAMRMIPRVSDGWKALAQARIALREQSPGVDTLIEKVPKDLQGDPGLAFERFQWRARKGLNDDAISLALQREGSIEALGEPARWANWRRVLSRWLMRSGKGEAAYKLASAHGLDGGSAFADLEWLSGYLALTYLEDADLAKMHFETFRAAVRTPISLGRAGYWLGRAYEAAGNPAEARKAYLFGATYQTSFYGQLASEKAGVPLEASLSGKSEADAWQDAEFAQSSVFQAANLLFEAGERNLAERFLTHLAESLDEEALIQLGDFALSLSDPHLALMVAKQAAKQGVVVPRAYFPLVDLGVEDLPVSEELALAIARRESEFDPVVKSGVGARGLMQVMPRTAREVAGKINLKFDVTRLLSDPVYNATLGTAYLAEMSDVFQSNTALMAAAYNAGPSRPKRWIAEQGDPRSPDVDAVDWIEHIQFRETRNYVMRVMESLAIYRARISGETGPITLSDELKFR
jgi:soluble lytic murein transglycosylase